MEDGANAPVRRITIWGPPGCGKTTFLAALNIALVRQHGDWNIRASDEAAAQTLVARTSTLTVDRTFPTPTIDIEHHRWTLTGRIRRPARFWRDRKQRDELVEIALDVVDMPGESSAPRALGQTEQEQMLGELVSSNAIIFFIDPTRELEASDSFGYVFGVLAQLIQLKADSEGLVRARLPHYVAVCLSKFDDLRVKQSAEKLGLLSYDGDDPYGFPRVHDEDARELVMKLFAFSRSGYATVLLDSLDKYFLADRVRYFVTSSVGFYVDPDRSRFDPEDFQNVVLSNDRQQIRGPIHPINVAEPLLWLCQQLITP